MELKKIFKGFKGKIFKRKDSKPTVETPVAESSPETVPLILNNTIQEDKETNTLPKSYDDMQEVPWNNVMDTNQEKIVKNAITTLKNVVQSVNPVRNFVSMITGKKISLNGKKENSSLVRAAKFFKAKFKVDAIESIEKNTTDLKTSVKNLFVKLNTLEPKVNEAGKKIFSDLDKIKVSIRQFTDLEEDLEGDYVSIKDSIDDITKSTQEVKKALKLTTRIYNKFDIKANSIKESIKRGLHLTKDE